MSESQRKFPKKGTLLYETVKRRYESGDSVKSIADSLGMKPSGLKDQLKNNGIQRQTRPPEPSESPLPEPYPPFNIKPFLGEDGRRDKEDIGLVISDLHIGKVTETYNLDIAKERPRNLTKSLERIIELHRPIGKLWIFDLGDNVQGENIHQGSNVDDTACGAYEQIHTYAIPALSELVLSVSQGVESVEFYGVDGNHGRYGKEATPKTNWDRFLYRSLADALKNQDNIEVHEPKTFYQLVSIFGFRFFLFHGNQVKATSGIPLFAIRRKLQEWYAYTGGFHYAYGGHFHTWGADTINSVADYQLCPPLVTGDEWALEIVGRASKPVQLCFGIHPHRGRTWEYKLYTDNSHLPQPINENVTL